MLAALIGTESPSTPLREFLVLAQTATETLAGNTLAWKKITLGISNTTRTQVDGLNENDAVALPSEKPLKDGMAVTPRFQ